MLVLDADFDRWERDKAKAALSRVTHSSAEQPRALNRFAFLTADGQAATPLENEALQGADDLLEMSFLDRCFLVRGCIGRIRFSTPRGRSYATGFLIAPGIILTNHHVFRNAAAARQARIEFGYWYDVAGQLPSVSNEYDLDPERFFVSNEELDFAAVAIADRSTLGEEAKARGYLRLIPTTGKAGFGEFVTILQHPDGEPMRIALRENAITRLEPDEPFLNYEADTAHGSSGAPVFNDSLQLIALHSSGKIKRDESGNFALKDGRFVSSLEGLGENDVVWETNMGFRVSRIVPALLAGARADFPVMVLALEAAMRGGDVLGATVAIAKDKPAEPELEEEMITPRAAGTVVGSSASNASSPTELVVPLELRISIGLAGPPPQPNTTQFVTPVRADLEAEALPLRIPIIYDGLDDRDGFDPDFLEMGGSAPQPTLTAKGRAIAAPLIEGSGHELKYAHFSVWMHKERRLALYTASNVDWRERRKIVEGKKTTRDALAGFPAKPAYAEQWVNDARIHVAHQLPDIFYTEDRGAFDKGHLVRRDDVCWGETYAEIQMANGDTYHVTNCSPQTKSFNQGRYGEENWGDLEDHVKAATGADNEKAIIYAGPIFGQDDPWFRGKDDHDSLRLKMPRRYWKIVVVRGEGGPEAYGFVLDQDVSAVTEKEFYVTDEWKGALKPISEIADLLRGWIDLNALSACDQYQVVLSG